MNKAANHPNHILNAKKLTERAQLIKKVNEERYLENPKQCLQCNSLLGYIFRKQKFCSRSCSTKFNNTQRKVTIVFCKMCEKELHIYPKSTKTFCNKGCRSKFIKIQNEKKFIKGISLDSKIIRELLKEKLGNFCSECKIESWNNKKITLQMDHIDGNAGNNLPNNLRLLCPNCHSQTETFGAKNRGFGRKSRGLKHTNI